MVEKDIQLGTRKCKEFYTATYTIIRLLLKFKFEQKDTEYYDLLQRFNIYHEIESEEGFLQMFVEKMNQQFDSKISKFEN